MVTSVRVRCGSCSWGGRGALHTCSHHEPHAPSAPPDQHPRKVSPISVASWSPWKSLPPLAFAISLRFAFSPEKLLKKQHCGMRGHAQSWKTAALAITGGKIRALKKASKPTVLGWLCQVSMCVSHHLPALPPSSGQQGLQRCWAHHYPPASAAVSFHAPMNGLGRGKWGLWHIFPNQNKAGKSNFRPGLIRKWYQYWHKAFPFSW